MKFTKAKLLLATLLLMPSVSFAETILNLDDNPMFDITNSGKEPQYTIWNLIEFLVENENNPKTDEDKIQFVKKEENISLNAFEERERKSELLARYEQYVQNVKDIVFSIDYFSMSTVDSEGSSYYESGFTKRYDFDNQIYYILGSQDQKISQEEYAYRNSLASTSYYPQGKFESKDAYFCLDRNYIYNGNIKISIPACKDAYIDLSVEDAKKIFYVSGHYNTKPYLDGQEHLLLIKRVFLVKNNKKIISSDEALSGNGGRTSVDYKHYALDAVLDKATIRVYLQNLKQEKNVETDRWVNAYPPELIYEAPLKYKF